MKTSLYKILLGVIFSLGSYFGLLGQQQIIITENIEWQEPSLLDINEEQVVYLNFKNNGFTNPETLLPTITKQIILPVDVDVNSIKIAINDKSFTWPSPEEHISLIDSVNFDQIPVDKTISKTRDKVYLYLSLIPLLRNNTDPTFKKLDRFTITVSYDMDLTFNTKSISSSNNIYASNSVLKDGKWVKVKVNETGIHKISYSELESMGFTSPASVSVYGNGGKMVDKINGNFRYDDLTENAIWHNNNAIYFYAVGTKYWDYDESFNIFKHELHDYTDDAIYFLTDKNNSSKTISKSDEQNGSATVEVTSFDDYRAFETNNENLLSSGRMWLGEKFSYYGTMSYDFDMQFENIIQSEQCKVYVQLAARSTSQSSFDIKSNDTHISSVSIPQISSGDHTGYYARSRYSSSQFSADSDNISINITYNGSTSSIGYLDFVGVNVKRQLLMTNSQMQFRNIDIVFPSQIAKYNLGNTSHETVIWDITEHTNPKLVNHTQSDTNSSFNYDASTLKEFVAFNPNQNFPGVSYISDVANQDLHNAQLADYIIVSHPDFIDQANRLATIHNAISNLSTLVVTPQNIYNEFSSGQPDVSAIRDFMKMLYDKAGNDIESAPKYLLLFGDGSYDNRSTTANTNKIITYQSTESFHQSWSFVSDDFFGFLDDGEGGDLKSNILNIGIGRFPVNTIEEATNAVDKTENYLTQQLRSPWKSTLTFVADDGDSNIHMRDADEINTSVSNAHPEFTVNKVYFDAYVKESTLAGQKYPEVEEEIYNALHQGTLVFNYTGHGGTSQLSAEGVVTKESINTWTNISTLPLFMTATCEFSRFDDNDLSGTAGELVFLSPLGGAIALFTTTRLAYSGQNKTISKNFYSNVFEKDEFDEKLRFGEIIRRTKNTSGNTINKLNFTLLGDPALQLTYPNLDASTKKINDVNIKFDSDEQAVDTLKALSLNMIHGDIKRYEIIEDSGMKDTILVSDFNGELDITIRDKPQIVTCLGQNSTEKFVFEKYLGAIYKGKSSVVNGQFASEFIVPKDIKYNYDFGKISYYANSGDEEAFGAFSDIVVGGIDEDAIDDGEGPKIKVFLNNRSFKSGDKTTPAPLLLVDLFDESGINTTGTGIGHDITCIIDNNTSQPIILNNFYSSKLDSYQEGNIEYNMSALEPGEHSLTIKAWDSFNNSNETTIQFHISTGKSIELNNSKVYPNPISSGNEAYFTFEHDEPNLSMNIEINIYSINGELLSKQNTAVVSLGNTIPPISWKAKYSNGRNLNAGIYLYKLNVTSETGREGNLSGKIMVTQ